jgi:LysM repeat protein
MKAQLCLAALSMVFTTPLIHAAPELDSLRARCAEQERQIKHLEQENSRLRGEKPAAKAATKTEESTVEAKKADRSEATSYTVKAGDSIERIAKRMGTTPAKLASANGFKPSALIHPGQKLKSPNSPASKPKAATPKESVAKNPEPKETAAKEPAAKPAPSTAVDQPKPAAKAPAESSPAQTTEKKIRPVTIDGEMTYGEFATKHGTNPGRLNALNGLELTSSTLLAKGSELYVPTQP